MVSDLNNYWKVSKLLPNKENKDAINDFLLNLKTSNRSELTIIHYRVFLENFFMDMDESISSLSPDLIIGWFKANKKHLKDSTFSVYLRILSSFCNFCVQESLIELSPIKKRWFPRLPKAVPKYLEKREIAKLRSECERTSLRNQAIVEFMLTSGCRVAEMQTLNIEDVNIENRTAFVIGKGKKIRCIHFSDKCALLLENYFEIRQNKDNSPLFVSSREETRLSISGIEHVLSSLGEKAGLRTRLHPHRLRHTFATELLAKGAELSFISDELGHADIKTTQIYARLPKQEIISQYRKFMG